MELKTYLQEKKICIDNALDMLLPGEDGFAAPLFRAMRYSVLGEGKRLRPILCLAAVESVGGNPDRALPAACALEFVHAYSLIHDDLPCMDDDDMRRGKPSTHRAFGEATALLAGDALLAGAFEALTTLQGVEGSRVVALIRELSHTAGASALVGGQVVDCISEGESLSEEKLRYIHANKTAALIQTSVAFGGIIEGAPEEVMKTLRSYGHAVGMAFQITDDILDETGEEKKIGARVGGDRHAGKTTFPAFFGIDESHRIACEFIAEAMSALDQFGGAAWLLREIARSIPQRER